MNILLSCGPPVDSIVSKHLGGQFIRRSPWKRDAKWQFIPVNLNCQVLNAEKIHPHLETSDTKDVSSACVTITMGCVSAHGLGYKGLNIN